MPPGKLREVQDELLKERFESVVAAINALDVLSAKASFDADKGRILSLLGGWIGQDEWSQERLRCPGAIPLEGVPSER